MKKISVTFFSFLCLMIFSLTANAALELELTQGVDKAMPLAVLPFQGEGHDTTLSLVTSVIKSDLKNSGRFRLITPKATNSLNSNSLAHISKSATIQAIDYKKWQEQGADAVVTGKITPVNDNKYQVEFYLVSTLGEQQLLSKESFTAKKTNFRRLAHHISDIVYEQLTGNKGIFSTRIAYVIVQRAHTMLMEDAGQSKALRYSLEIADADGHNPHALVRTSAPIMSPTWSPDGQKIAFVSFENKRSSIFVVNVINGKRSLISSFPGINGAPAWSPDGKSMALVLSRSGNAKIYLLNLKTRKMKQLTHGTAIDTEPNFSPDGRRIIFTSDRGGSPQIYALNLRRKTVSRLSYDGKYNASPEYLPNGKEFVLLHKSQGVYNIAIQEFDSGQLRNLTSRGDDESPSIAPNGQMVLYTSKRGVRRVLNVVSVDGKVRLRLPAVKGNVQEPAWSPFL